MAESRALGHYKKGKALLKKGKKRLGRSQMRQAVAKAPEQAGYWKAAGLAELSLGNTERGIEDLRTAGKLYAKRGHLQTSIEMADKILSLRPKDVSAHLLSGKNKFKVGLYEDAKNHIKVVLDAHPGHPKASHLWRLVHLPAKTYRELQRPAKAVNQVFASR